jgi:hypothetical protein
MEPGQSSELYLLFQLKFAFWSLLKLTELIKKITSLTAALAAFWHIYVKSAPEKPSVMLAKKFTSTSFARGVFLRFAFKIPNLEGWSGKGM